MVMRSFLRQFVPAVENGLDQIAGVPLRHHGVVPKLSTIRAPWKNGRVPRVGETEHLVYAARTKQYRRLGEATCTRIAAILLNRPGAAPPFPYFDDDSGFPQPTAVELSQGDGFTTVAGMLDFFEQYHGLPFTGFWISWDPRWAQPTEEE